MGLGMDIFSDQTTPPTPVVETGLKKATFTWDSSVTGAIAGPGGGIVPFPLGTIGTDGKAIGKARCYVYSDTVDPDFIGGGVGTANAYFAVYIGAGVLSVPAAYLDDGSGDALKTNGWRLTQGTDPAFPAVVYSGLVGVQEVGIFAENLGGSYNLTGKMQIEIEYLEEA